jgi:hypothetical protein
MPKCNEAWCLLLGSCLIALATIGCGDQATTRGFTVRDSLGVQVAENSHAAWDSTNAWSLAPQPSVTIGVEDGDSSYLFYGVVGSQRLSDGRLAVADYGSHEIRVYDSTGQFLLSAGRQGDGPGEYRFMSLFWRLPGDTLVVSSSRGLTMFNSQGSYVGSIQLDATPEGSIAQGVAQLRDGTVLAVTSSTSSGSQEGSPLVEPMLHFHSYAATGRYERMLDSVPAGPLWRPEGSRGPRRIPFHTYPGRTAVGDRFYIAQGDEAEIGIWSRSGVLERVIRWIPPDRTVTPDIIDRHRQHELDRARSPEARRSEADFLDEVPFPSRLPALAESSVIVSRTEEIWAEAYRLPWEADVDWYVFSPVGEWLGFVRMPTGFVLHDVDSDVVVGSQRDDLGVEYVRAYRLVKP